MMLCLSLNIADGFFHDGDIDAESTISLLP